MDWKPIETVPGDDVPVLVYAPGEPKRIFEATASKDGCYYDPVYSEWAGNGATHWMPLPDPPEVKSEPLSLIFLNIDGQLEVR